MAAGRAWTLEDLERLPDDGNQYEVVRGELFVTPAPSRRHQLVIARLAHVLDAYVEQHELGTVFQARSVVRCQGSEAEPDLHVSETAAESDWDDAPTPILIVEVLCRSTRRRDLNEKRAYYLEDVGVPEYWMVYRETCTIRVAKPGCDDVVTGARLSWHPAGAARPLEFDVASLFD